MAKITIKANFFSEEFRIRQHTIVYIHIAIKRGATDGRLLYDRILTLRDDFQIRVPSRLVAAPAP